MRLLFSVLVALAACGGGPTAPSDPKTTLIAISIEPAATALHVGLTVALTALGQYTDGHTTPLVVSWSSGNAAVATVDPSGRLAAISVGSTRVTAVSGSTTASLDVTVLPHSSGPWADFSGTWSGNSLELTCNWLGGPGPSPCEGHYNGGLTLPTVFVIQQQADAVSCAVTIGGINKFTGTLTGSVKDDGHLNLSGALSGNEVGVTKIDVADFTNGGGTLIGTFSWTNVFTNAFGVQTVREDWRLVDVTRTQ